MTKVADESLSRAFYQAYKPLRNLLRRLSLEESLIALWQYSAHLSGDVRLPALAHGVDGRGMPLDIAKSVHPWELSLLAREVILHASSQDGLNLRSLSTFAKAINRVKDLSAFGAENMDMDGLMLQIHRLAHQQFPVQRGVQLVDLMRYRLIFQHPSVTQLFTNGIGLTSENFFFLGFAVAASLMARPRFITNTDFTPFGISDDQRDAFFKLLVRTKQVLRQMCEEKQKFGPSWAYTTNPLAYAPLVNVDAEFPHRVYGPVPNMVLRRITSGVYFDLVNLNGFNQAYGPAFDHYIGLVMRKTLGSTPLWGVHKPKPYRIKNRGELEGADWILSDGTATLFIECKAARPQAKAIEAESKSDVEQTIDRLAAMIVQNYQNIAHALVGLTDWRPNLMPVYNLVVTLEDFIAFGAVIAPPVRAKVLEGLKCKGLSAQLIDEVPYSLVSAHEFEGICSVLRAFSVNEVFVQKNAGECREWLFSTFCMQPPYLEAWGHSRRLHADVFEEWRARVDEMSAGKFKH
ncbi:Uncharacterised protein [Achromobacter xylosoxidans]|uniref:hypothetical protein n=1 Tax=Alcaligenes xylosoxydans xylosoxydans TaxID=85698 RepID=UPI0006C3E1E5|nr:hypothetical protein [Achromobacter xylosoxidans]QEQ24623.1 hypothetical protein F0U64_20740 [Achromobacter xylosoxidans]CUJ69456.1 Uncharacterised protein [Achromobacter xylosoxidans]CUK22086.1 Uncharacterised protein [Achromobacter xylosoxidans]